MVSLLSFTHCPARTSTPFLSFHRSSHITKITHNAPTLPLLNSISTTFDKTSSLRLVSSPSSVSRQRSMRSTVCHAVPFNAETLQWVSAVSAVILLSAKGTAIQKSFLVPLFALQAPGSAISWIKGEYGTWTAFLALFVRLFYFIPGELDLPFFLMLFVIVAPYQALNLRGSQAGAIVSVVIAAYLAFQHFSRVGGLRKAFDVGSVVATLAVICITAVSCLFLL